MLNMNRVTLVGYVGQNVEVRDLPSGVKAGQFSVATTERWRDKEGVSQEKTQWHRVVVYGGAVEAVGKWVRKGVPVLVEGSLEYRTFEGKEGQTVAVTEVIVSGREGRLNVLELPEKEETDS